LVNFFLVQLKKYFIFTIFVKGYSRSIVLKVAFLKKGRQSEIEKKGREQNFGLNVKSKRVGQR